MSCVVSGVFIRRANDGRRDFSAFAFHDPVEPLGFANGR
jgi:hypothetical protein